MTVGGRLLQQQNHPVTLLLDSIAAVAASVLLWQQHLIRAALIAIGLPIVAAAIVFAFADTTRERGMTPSRLAMRAGGALVLWAGAWWTTPWICAAGAVLIALSIVTCATIESSSRVLVRRGTSIRSGTSLYGLSDKADHQGLPHIERYLRPTPRVRAGMLLGRNRAATACMDLSDGLADGLRQIAEASNAGITVDADTIPFADGVLDFHRSRGDDPIAAALSGGDDYELLFTARPSQRGRLRAFRNQVGDLPITKIGVVTKIEGTPERRLVVRTADGERELPSGFEHFR